MLREAFPHDILSTTEFQIGYLEGNTDCRGEGFEGYVQFIWWRIKNHFVVDGRSEIADAGRSEGESASKKRKTDVQDVPSLSVTADDDEVYKKLKAKHPDMANPKLRFWAKLISRGRYDDYNVPPIPLLQDGSSSSKKTKKSNLSDALVDAAVAFAVVSIIPCDQWITKESHHFH